MATARKGGAGSVAAAKVIQLDRRRGPQVPEELERKGLLFFEILDERQPDVDARIQAISERLADIGKAISPIGLELATRPKGPLLEIAAFPATAFGTWAEATHDGPPPKLDA